jgi:methionyl-tRNA formyltransferase
MDTRIDHGDILFQKRFPIPGNCWVNDLYKLTYAASLLLFKESLADIVNNNVNPIPQQTLESKYGTSLHFRHEIAELKKIDLSWDKEKIERHVRATFMRGFEPPYTEIDGVRLYFSPKF